MFHHKWCFRTRSTVQGSPTLHLAPRQVQEEEPVPGGHFHGRVWDEESHRGGQPKHCTADALHCTALHCTVLHSALHCTALHFTALYCTTLHLTVPYTAKVDHFFGSKPYLGGWRHQKTRTEYHNAATQVSRCMTSDCR